MMDPNIGRFTTFDDFEGDPSEPLHLHKYAYAGGDSVNNGDPDGHDFLSEFIQVAGVTSVLGQVAAPATRATTRPTTRPVNSIDQDATDRVSNLLNCGGWAWNMPNANPMTDPRTGNFLDQLGFNAGPLQTMLASPTHKAQMIKAVNDFLASNTVGVTGHFIANPEAYFSPSPDGYHRVRLYWYSPPLASGKDFHWITQDTTGDWSGKGGPDKPATGESVGAENISKEFIGMWIISTPPRHGIAELPE